MGGKQKEQSTDLISEDYFVKEPDNAPFPSWVLAGSEDCTTVSVIPEVQGQLNRIEEKLDRVIELLERATRD